MKTRTSAPPLIIRGRCMAPPATDPTYDGWEFFFGEDQRVWPKAKGIPLRIKHDLGAPAVGKLVKAYKDKDGWSVVDMEVDATPEGYRALERVAKGELTELSVGFDAMGNKKTYQRLSDYIPKEISLVEKGANPDSLIFAVRVDDTLIAMPHRMNAVYKPPHLTSPQDTRMSDLNQSVTSATSALAANTETALPTPAEIAELKRLAKLGREAEENRLKQLTDIFANVVFPEYTEFFKNNPDKEVPDFGPKIDKVMANEAGAEIMAATASVIGTMAGFKAKYEEEKAARLKAENELKSFKASENVFRKEHQPSLGELFMTQNSADTPITSSSASEPEAKRVKTEDNKSLGGLFTTLMGKTGELRNTNGIQSKAFTRLT